MSIIIKQNQHNTRLPSLVQDDDLSEDDARLIHNYAC